LYNWIEPDSVNIVDANNVTITFTSAVAGKAVLVSDWITIAGTGEVNTASNLGAGEWLFNAKVGVDLQFKSIVAWTGSRYPKIWCWFYCF